MLYSTHIDCDEEESYRQYLSQRVRLVRKDISSLYDMASELLHR